MDPLKRINEAKNMGILPPKVSDLIEKRFSLIISGIERIEKASQINYPIAYVDPSIIIADNYNSVDIGILFARTIPVTLKNSVKVLVTLKNHVCTCLFKVKPKCKKNKFILPKIHLGFSKQKGSIPLLS